MKQKYPDEGFTKATTVSETNEIRVSLSVKQLYLFFTDN
ncbi:MAG: hypothetical protein ACJA2S_000142 [Cyclobacteriaceae bacterium]|jgi:hypothetical protein